jgi:hypothetical protein
MKKVQKIIVIIYLILFAIAFIYVPWKIDYEVTNLDPRVIGTALRYSVFWHSPSLDNLSPYASSDEDVKIKEITMELRLIPYELIPLTAIFGALFVLTLGPKKD